MRDSLPRLFYGVGLALMVGWILVIARPIILPVMAIFIGQLMGAVVLDQTLLLSIASALTFIDVALMYFATRLFQRENILTRWK